MPVRYLFVDQFSKASFPVEFYLFHIEKNHLVADCNLPFKVIQMKALWKYCHAFALYAYLFPGGHSVKLSDRGALPRDPTPYILYTLFDRIGTLSGVASM